MLQARVVEFYGLPGVGKSTIARGLVAQLESDGFRICTRETVSCYLASLSVVAKIGLRVVTLWRLLERAKLVWSYVTGTKPLNLRRFFKLFLKREVLSRLQQRGGYDLFVLDQWLLQHVWSLFVAVRHCPSALPTQLVQYLAPRIGIVMAEAPLEDVVGRLWGRAHGLSRFDGLDRKATMAALSACEAFTSNLVLPLLHMEYSVIRVDAREPVIQNARRIADWLRGERDAV